MEDSNKTEMTIEEIRASLIKTMNYIDQVCRKNNIKYSLAYGTLIGTIRHKGFIPWDDDIDIILPRVDYNRLVKLLKDDNNPAYKVINTDNAYFPWTKIIDTSTYIIEPDDYGIKDYGLFIDIFPIDDVPDPETKEWKSMKKKLNLLKRLMLGRAVSYKHAEKLNGFEKFKFLAAKTVLMVMPINFYGKLWTKIATKYNGQNTGYKAYAYFEGPIKAEYFVGTEDVKFENETYMMTKGYDGYLRSIFGDYMQLPPEEEQKSNHRFKAYKK